MSDQTPGLFAADPAVRKDASISECGRYRYTLHRWWEPGRTRLGFIMLNPSTADADIDDPTIRRCLGFARALGCDGIRVFNLYAFRATKPADLWKADEPTGGDRNDDLLREVLRQAKSWPVIAAWGANAKPDRVAEVMSWRGSEHLLALGLTKAGAPRHPLYLRSDNDRVHCGCSCGRSPRRARRSRLVTWVESAQALSVATAEDYRGCCRSCDESYAPGIRHGGRVVADRLRALIEGADQ